MKATFALVTLLALAAAVPSAAETKTQANACPVGTEKQGVLCPTEVKIWWHQLDVNAEEDTGAELSFFFWHDADVSYLNDKGVQSDKRTASLLNQFREAEVSSFHGDSLYLGDIALMNMGWMKNADESAAYQLFKKHLLMSRQDTDDGNGGTFTKAVEELYIAEDLQEMNEGYLHEELPNTPCGGCFWSMFVDAHEDADASETFQKDTAEALYAGQDTALGLVILSNGDDAQYERGMFLDGTCSDCVVTGNVLSDTILEYKSLNSDLLPNAEDLAGFEEGFNAYNPMYMYDRDEYKRYTADDVERQVTTKLWEAPDAGHAYLHYYCMPPVTVHCPEFSGSVSGDPHFVGFDGVAFDYHGVPGAVFNIITTPTFQFNALLGPELVNGLTYMSSTALSLSNGMRIQVSAVGDLLVHIDDIIMEHGTVIEQNGVKVDRTDAADVLSITMEDVVLTLAAHKGQFLDITRVALIRAPAAIGGVLGRTALMEGAQVPPQEEEYYFVSDLWASDFQGDQFSRSKRSAGKASRKSLINSLTSMVVSDAMVTNFQAEPEATA